MEKRKIFSIISFLLCLILCFSAFACGGGGGDDSGNGGTGGTEEEPGDEDEPSGGRGEEKLSFNYNDSTSSNYQAKMLQVINHWNTTYAGEYGFKVGGATAGSTNYATSLTTNNVPDVVEISDSHSQAVLSSTLADGKSVLLPLDGETDGGIDLTSVLNKYGANSRDRFKSGYETVGGKVKYSPYAANARTYIATSYIDPTVLIYNQEAFEAMGITVVSMTEEEAITAGLAPVGYHVYSSKPSATPNATPTTLTEINQIAATSSGTVSTKSVTGYRVFNNKIPMGWEEYLALCSIFTDDYNTQQTAGMTHGVNSEYWFYLGWSVGGDCLISDKANKQLLFGLSEEYASYLVVADTTVNGVAYEAGELLEYSERKYVAENPSAVTSSLYKIKDIKDAITMFVALSNNKDVKISYTDAEKTAAQAKGMEQVAGYGVAYATGNGNTTDYVSHFTTKKSAMMVRGYGSSRDKLSSYTFWNVAPLPQYKEFAGAEDGVDVTTKATGVKTVNGTEVKGYLSTHSADMGFAIPRNAKHLNWAKDFIKYLLSNEVQTMLIEGSSVTPVVTLRRDSAYRTAFAANYTQYNQFDFNIDALIDAAYYGTAADWAYTSSGSAWVNVWSVPFNNAVRIGDMTMYDFWYGSSKNANYDADDRNGETYPQRVEAYLVNPDAPTPVEEYEIISHKTFQNI